MSRIILPNAPSAQSELVKLWREPLTIPTYEPMPPDRNPMFLEKRVYQGSSGKVYPLPFIDRISESRIDRQWDAVHLENEYLRLVMLPEIGGRIHIALDKTNGYDFIYRQDVIKPALVGLAGPWISGGIEFNWPQHHRPTTFMRTDVFLEEHADGSKTAWFSEHEPMNRMKGMHGVCLRPGRAAIELKVRLYNRTEFTQTHLWWANVATRAHEKYQSFFPPDVSHVADHAKRAMSRFPHCDGHYYGVDYAARAEQGVPPDQLPGQYPQQPDRYSPDDLSWYANIPVPTSYMCMGSKQDFLGGYDHAAGAGLVHICSHHISPGKKQWTWGNHDFGYAWDCNLTDADDNGEHAPYIELMAGVFTDNQPDFSFLAPGETRTFTQFWYPIQQIGPAQMANLDAAVSLRVEGQDICLGVSVSSPIDRAVITLERDGTSLARFERDLKPGAPLVECVTATGDSVRLIVRDNAGGEVIAYQPVASTPVEIPPPAIEPLPPRKIASADELYLTGLHLEQYRHATRMPEPYWLEALRRDPSDSRCNAAMGKWHLRRGEFTEAERFLRRSIERLTARNPNPPDGDALYHLGITLRYLDRDDDAYDALYKATWNQPQQSAAFFALAQIDSKRGQWNAAIEHLDDSLRSNVDHLAARNLKAVALRKVGRIAEANDLLRETLRHDPLDWAAAYLIGEQIHCDDQTRLDLAIEFGKAGQYAQAIGALGESTGPMSEYARGYLHDRAGEPSAAMPHRRKGASAPPDYCFPSRLDELLMLQSAIAADPNDAKASYYLGNLLYDRKRHREAIDAWHRSAQVDPSFATVWRNLGIGFFNVLHKPAKAKAAYDRALAANPSDARVLYERDQLSKRIGIKPAKRLRELRRHPELISARDDLSIELCTLLNQTGAHKDAVRVLESRVFQPWEGGEGLALAQHTRAHLALGMHALAGGKPAEAISHFNAALKPPANLGEAPHLLANRSDIHYWLGKAYDAVEDRPRSQEHWNRAAAFQGDFQAMAVRPFSEMTVYSALSMRELGRDRAAKKLLHKLLTFAQRLERTKARIDYFATSLPTMLLFDDDLQQRQRVTALVMQGQALVALNKKRRGVSRLKKALEMDPNSDVARQWIQQGQDSFARQGTRNARVECAE